MTPQAARRMRRARRRGTARRSGRASPGRRRRSRAAPSRPPAAARPSAAAWRRGRSRTAARSARPRAARGTRAAPPTGLVLRRDLARGRARSCAPPAPWCPRARARSSRRAAAHGSPRSTPTRRSPRGRRARNPCTSSCRISERHAGAGSSVPMPNTESRSCRCRATFSVSLPSSTSTTCAAPNVWPVRYTADSSLRAASVPSHVAGGLAQLSQLPHAVGARLAEVLEQRPAPALGDLAPAEQRIELRALAALVLLVGFGCRDELRELHDVLQAVDHPRVGGLAVAAGAARLLVVRLDALRQVEMRDEPDVGLVDAHAERDRRDDDHRVLDEEPALMLGARLGRQARVIRQRVESLLAQPLRGALGLVARQAIDDAGLAAMVAQELRAAAAARRSSICTV